MCCVLEKSQPCAGWMEAMETQGELLLRGGVNVGRNAWGACAEAVRWWAMNSFPKLCNRSQQVGRLVGDCVRLAEHCWYSTACLTATVSGENSE